MNTLNNLDKIQQELASRSIDAWILPDYRGSNEIFATIAGGKYFMTRRAVLLIPVVGTPKALIHIIDKPQFAPAASNFDVNYYRTWQEYAQWIEDTLKPLSKVVTEYSPDNAIPTMSQVDGGTIDLFRKYVEVVSSADLYQKTISAWTLARLRRS
jgi:Xaa-Pro dipeptidase